MKVYLVRTVADKHIQAAFTTEQAAIDYGNSWIDHRADRAEWAFFPATGQWINGLRRPKPPVLEVFHLIVNES